ncbi:hypothetical protein NQ317_003051 [Molorchus minor]|uniref:Uncharacterized protein n=1 Tax=Molorchus minor TaxID=1323400 RepID=A0ABQ9JK59_9CUCU|nr:hypothetical protein NQ317_003051 [Molorchus minor]
MYQCTPKDPPYSTIRWLIQRRACPGQVMSSAADRGLNWTESRSRALKKWWMAGNSTASLQSDVTCPGWPEVNDPTIFRDTFLSWDLDWDGIIRVRDKVT